MALPKLKGRKTKGARASAQRTRTYRTPRQARAQETVDAILSAAKTLLVREGVEACTTNAIARLAGVSIGSLYQYFASREAVITELSRRHVEQGLKLLFSEADALLDASLRVGARRLISLMIELHRQDPGFHRALEESHPGLGARAQLAKMEAQVLAAARAYLAAHQAELIVDDLDRAAFVVITSIEAVVHEAALKRPALLNGDLLSEDLTRMVLGYLTGKAAPR